ncbi:MAG: phosphate signaling complex protein PhoU [Candidatus Eisenbacteria bacterium]|nr:phosphate signaling complex protein PhoU [Candidatus Eisenbacteria bacterium]
MDHHIDRHFDDALAALKQQILMMSERVESMIADCITALQKRDAGLAAKIIEADHSVNALEMSIDEQCIHLLARYQPAASDLRFITRGLKIATDLERIGDLAVNFAQRVIDIVKEGSPGVDLTNMASIVQAMLKESLEAFVNSDAEKAEGVFLKDDTVDEMTETIVTELIERASREPQSAKKLFPATSIVRYLERVADHATNIAELAIYMVKGRDIRHGMPH